MGVLVRSEWYRFAWRTCYKQRYHLVPTCTSKSKEMIRNKDYLCSEAAAVQRMENK